MTRENLLDHDVGGLQCPQFWNRRGAIGRGQPTRVEPDRRDAGRTRPLDVGLPGVPDHQSFRGLSADAFQRQVENLWVRLRPARFLGHDQRIDVHVKTALPHLLALFGEEIVGYHRDAGVPSKRGEQGGGARHRLARGHIFRTIDGSGVRRLSPGDAGRHEQAPEPLDPGVVQLDLTGENLLVQRLEMLRVLPLEIGECHHRETGMRTMYGRER